MLDDEAVAAMMTAQPFPNPPLQLVTDGEIRFQFGFSYDPEKPAAAAAIRELSRDAGTAVDGGPECRRGS